MVDPDDSRQEWIANAFYEPPKVWAAGDGVLGSVEKFGMTGCNCETGDEWVSPYEVIAFAAAR